MVKIAVLVSGGGTNLQALIDAQQAGKLTGGSIDLVVSSKADAYALERAKKSDIDTAVVIKKECRDNEEYNQKLIDLLQERGIGLVILAGFMTVLSPAFCQAFENRIINVHPALIPSFCGDGYYGLRVHQEALKKGVKVTGATVHFVNAVTDGGPIIAQKAVEVRQDDTPESLQKRVMEQAEWILLPKAASWFCQGKLTVEDGRVYMRD